MRIAIHGPSELTEFDKQEIEDNLRTFLEKDNEIAILAYRSIEIEVFKFFVEHANEQNKLAEKLHIYTFQQLENLPIKIKDTIEYLIDLGAHHTSFSVDQVLIKRPEYVAAWRNILSACELTISFYDGEKPTLLIPVDEAKIMNKKSIIYSLPRLEEELFNLEPEAKIRIVE